jgi:hypothetical protein
MRTPMSSRILLASLTAVLTLHHSEVTAQSRSSTENARWGLEAAEVPDLLRLHCPTLRGDFGILVLDVVPDGPAAAFGVRPGDILMTSDGTGLRRSDELPDPEAAQQLGIVRRGQIRWLARTDLGSGRSPDRDSRVELPWDRFPRWARPPQFGRGSENATASSSSFADPSSAVSVSRAGNHVSLEIALPGVGQPIRMSGTPEQIRRQLQTSSLPEAAKQRIGSAISEVR